MCGIIAVLQRRSDRTAPPIAALLELAERAGVALTDRPDLTALDAAGTALSALDRDLRGVAGTWTLLQHPAERAVLADRLEHLHERVQAFEQSLDRDAVAAAPDAAVEARNAALLRLKDALWAVRCDRLTHAAMIAAMAGTQPIPHRDAAMAWSSLAMAFSALDRLEVRGRDSAGISIVVTGIDTTAPALATLLGARAEDPLCRNGAVRVRDGSLVFVYKHSAEIGELGDNVRALRASACEDDLLQAALRQPGCEALVLGHTRWASVGIISEPNAHPLDEVETIATEGPLVLGVLNGDVDNHHDLVRRHGLQLHETITTDAKVIPTLVSRGMSSGHDLQTAFLRTVTSFEGSVAIGATSTRHPGRLALALRGSGQALYVGCAEDLFVVASEPYGVIEACATYLRLDGETPGNPANPSASRGQVVMLDGTRAGEIAGIERFAYDGTRLPVTRSDLKTAAVTTRDIDRGDFRHYLLKEITQAPLSLQKTLRGRIVRKDQRLRASLPTSSVPAAVDAALREGTYRHVLVIGQGTAAVAGQAVAAALADALVDAPLSVRALPATELSGFGLRDDMRDTLIVAISQSGTTTDTNRTVDLARARGATVLAIVNRRGSDLCDKADGVLFTSDGRDVEMSVASTKAFYAQCAAGQLLALALARAAGCADDDAEHELLTALVDLPKAMQKVLEQDQQIAAIARRLVPGKRYWALVGNGRNRVAAAEIRIKLSELCYKSIACDATEDKKHIDLSSEPLILVCAAGSVGSLADDVAKEVAIYQAHKATPIVIATAGETRFAAAAATIEVPQVAPALAYVLSTMAGHLFGYRAALAIDESARPLRHMRAAIEEAFGEAPSTSDALELLQPRLQPHWVEFRKDLLLGRYDGTLEARTASRLTSLGNHAMGLTPLDSFAVEFGEPGTPGVVIDRLTEELTAAIDQLTRPVDAIKHQAKTVTVGISRADEALLSVPLVHAVMAAGAVRDRLGYRDLRTLADLDPAVEEVLGSTRYAIEGDLDAHAATIRVVDQRGIAARLPSRTAGNPTLRGTKHLVAVERQCLVAQGRSDDRTVILVPEVEQHRTIGITLLHVRFREHLPASALRGVLGGYRNRYAALADAVTETEPTFDETLLESRRVVELLCEPVSRLADLWRRGKVAR